MTDQTTSASSTTGQKKGLPVWGWVLIGCGGLIVLGFVMFAAVGFFAVKKGAEFAREKAGVDSLEELGQALEDNPAKFSAEMMIRLNPELEIVESDDAAGTITFRNTKSKEVVTLNYEDIEAGEFSVTTDEGEFSVSASGAASGEGGVVFSGPEGETRLGGSVSLDDVPRWVPEYPTAEETVGSYSTRTAQGNSGMVSVKTSDGAQDVVDHFENWFEDEGWEVTSRSMSSAGGGTFGGIVGQQSDQGRTVNIGVAEQAGETQVTITYNEDAS